MEGFIFAEKVILVNPRHRSNQRLAQSAEARFVVFRNGTFCIWIRCYH